MSLRHFSQILIQLQTFDPHELSACKKSFHCWANLILQISQWINSCSVWLALQWEKTLRIYKWAPTPGAPLKPVWDDCIPGKRPRDEHQMKEITRIGRPDRDNLIIEFFKDRWAHSVKKRSEWGDWEWFCYNMVTNLAQTEPHYPDFTGLLVLVNWTFSPNWCSVPVGDLKWQLIVTNECWTLCWIPYNNFSDEANIMCW